MSNEITSALADINLAQLIAQTASGSSTAFYLPIAIVFLGSIARPLFVVVMSSIRPDRQRQPWNSIQLIGTSLGIFVLIGAMTGGHHRLYDDIKYEIVNPFRIAWLKQDTCRPELPQDCVTVFLMSGEYLIMSRDRMARRSYSEYWPEQSLTPKGRPVYSVSTQQLTDPDQKS
jgi:hypothetical protein